MAAHNPRWCDLEDSSTDEGHSMVRQNTFPFYLFLDVFLRGLFRRGISLGSMACLQQRLQADGRIATLPSSLQDIILHLTFRPRKIRCQVRAFVHALMHEECSAAVLRHWQAWLRLQCFYDPPVYCRTAYAAIYVYQL